jgi:hypothetical protein
MPWPDTPGTGPRLLGPVQPPVEVGDLSIRIPTDWKETARTHRRDHGFVLLHNKTKEANASVLLVWSPASKSGTKVSARNLSRPGYRYYRQRPATFQGRLATVTEYCFIGGASSKNEMAPHDGKGLTFTRGGTRYSLGVFAGHPDGANEELEAAWILFKQALVEGSYRAEPGHQPVR